MSTHEWINFPRMEGEVSKQAHADFPSDTFEREMGKERQFGITYGHRTPEHSMLSAGFFGFNA